MIPCISACVFDLSYAPDREHFTAICNRRALRPYTRSSLTPDNITGYFFIYHRILLYIYSYITGYFFIFIHNTNQTALSPGNICWLPASHRLMHHNRLQKQLCNYQNASFPLVSRKSSLLYRVRVRKHRFATITRHTGTA
ncbi:hypothetical protein OJO69_25910, partial [Escherichia coli]|nr:hypothetical protein [Escherichia coli]